jgi:glycine cleavage system regulatory protein
MTDVVLTLIGPDRPGLVEAVAEIIVAHGGNWLESRMTHLAGMFAGILRAELPPDKAAAALKALGTLESRGLRVVAEATPRPTSTPVSGVRSMVLELIGLDRPGIVREISQLLAAGNVNVEELTTDRESAPMSGEMMFRARANIQVSPRTDLAGLRAGLERLAADLMVEINLQDHPAGGKK